MRDLVIWWLTTEIISWGSFPLLFSLFSRLYDQGFGLSKTLGFFFPAYLNWILISLHIIPYHRIPLTITILIMVILSFQRVIKNKIFFQSFFKNRWKMIVSLEAIFLGGGLIFTFIRSFEPAIFGAEKFMDFAFLHRIVKSQHFPPSDPWLSGFPINYYYFGYYMIASLIKITTVAPSRGYNLALATWFALTLSGGFSLSYNLRPRLKVGILGAALVTIWGNLGGLWQIIQKGKILPFDYWWSSRIIPFTINEFPYFSFLHGDLHPHLLVLPLVLAALTLQYYWFSQMLTGKRSFHYFLLLALVLGGIGVTNFWDFPTQVLIYGILLSILFIRKYRAEKELLSGAKFMGWFLLLLSIAFITYLPFYLHYQSQFQGLGRVHATTRLDHFFLIFGFFLTVVIVYLGRNYYFFLRQFSSGERKSLTLGLILLILILNLMTQNSVITIFFPLLFWLGISLINLSSSKEELFVYILLLVGSIILIGCEILYLRDAYGEDLHRMNTVFKFYFQAWVLLGLIVSYLIFSFIEGKIFQTTAPRSIKYRQMTIKFVSLGLISLLGVTSLIYPFAATITRTNYFRGQPELDGAYFIRQHYPEDYRIIEWLKQQSSPDSVILEASGEPYSYYSRISTFTGLSTVLGWGNHEGLWRGSWEEVYHRQRIIDTIYRTRDVSQARSLLNHYRVKYVCIGTLERKLYPADSLDKFSLFMKPVFQFQNALIYENPF